MRQTAAENGVTVKAYAGTSGVLVACDVVPDRREGLLGFAVERRAGEAPAEWLTGKLDYRGASPAPDVSFPSNERPIQKFRWSDYRVFPDTDYAYVVHPVYGSPEHPEVQPGPAVRVRSAGAPRGRHLVLFNRAAAASQAFSKKFPDVEADLDAARREGRHPELPPPVLEWLSRGVLEQIVAFIGRAAGPEWALDIAIYEYEHPDIAEAVLSARQRGAEVRVVYHSKKGDHQTEVNEEHLAGLPPECKRGRVTSRIFHHKFALLSRLSGGARSPVAVLGGSTNFTENGVYRQANVVHVVEDEGVATPFLDLFEVLWSGATPAQTRKHIDAENPPDLAGPVFVGFSPRSGLEDLEEFDRLIRSARRDVLFCTAFDLYEDLEAALLGEPNDPIVRFGVQNQRSTLTGYHRDRTAQFSAAALLSTGLEGFLKESLAGQRGNILIHTKLVVIDFTSDDPIVISGSHNLSKAASSGNDENFMVLREPDVADCYGVELMRIYDHYRFRWAMKQKKGGAKPVLTPDDSWTDRYFRPDSLWWRDRVYFSGGDASSEG
jgi:phosphatidylserine/phosphatidylglycerophosphate/cardiolipin synthase-like enzyme